MQKHPVTIMSLIKRVDELMKKQINNYLAENGVTFSQMSVLITLEKWEGHSMKLKEIEKFFGVSQATMAGLVSRLEKNGYVEGYADENDKRIKLIRLSDKGKKLCEDNKTLIDNYEAKIVSVLEPQERKELERLLLKLYESNKEGEICSKPF